MTTITVVAAYIGGKLKYLKSNSATGEAPVDDPIQATNFTGREYDLRCFLTGLRIEGDAWYSKSGLLIDSVPLVQTLEVTTSIVTSVVGRELFK